MRTFQAIHYIRTLTSIKKSDAPEVFDSLEWPFVEDRLTLDGATRFQLRHRFNKWAEQAVVVEGSRAQVENNGTNLGASWHDYFIQVDEDAVQSVLAAPERDLHGEGFVNLVDSRWLHMKAWCRSYVKDHEGDVFESIDGCTEENLAKRGLRRAARAELRQADGQDVHEAVQSAGKRQRDVEARLQALQETLAMFEKMVL